MRTYYTAESTQTHEITVPQHVVDAIRDCAHTLFDRTVLGVNEVVQIVIEIGAAAGGALPDRETVYEIIEDVTDERRKPAQVRTSVLDDADTLTSDELQADIDLIERNAHDIDSAPQTFFIDTHHYTLDTDDDADGEL